MRRQRLFSIAAVGAMVFALAFALVPNASAANPAIVQQTGNYGAGVSSLSVNLGSLSAGDSIIVFEYFQTAAAPCTFNLTPTDGVGNTFRSFGCIIDGAGGAQTAYYVQSSGAGPSDSVSCNFSPSGTFTTEACYVFDVSNPAGAPTVLDTGTGTGGITAQIPVLVSASANSILLATVGFTGFCHSVTPIGQVPSGINPITYNPSGECTQGTTSFGLSGSWVGTVAAGSYQWVMDPVQVSNGGGYVSPAWSVMVVQIPGIASITTSTSYSATLVGWLAPDAAHFSASLMLMVYPLMGLVAGTTIAKMFRFVGDTGVYFALGGLTSGSFLADLPVAGSPSFTNLIPFAYGFVAALLTFLYWWNS